MTVKGKRFGGRIAGFNLLQRQAGVDPQVAELLAAYARLTYSRSEKLSFYSEDAPSQDWTRDVLCGWLARKNPDLDPRILQFLARYSRQLAARKLPVILSVRHLAKKMRLSEQRLRWMSRNAHALCRAFRIPKKDGSERRLVAPQGKLLTLQGWILRRILDRIKPHEAAQGFVRGHSIVDNAQVHAGRAVVVRLDLEDFFPTIQFHQVRKVFQRIGYPYRVATVLAGLCTVDGRLPQGAPTSPALSNLVCVNLDRRLHRLAERLQFTYTRYADDLVFSSENEKLPKLIPFFRQILREEGFEVNDRKVAIMGRGQRQIVTGLVVNECANLSRRQRRRLRAAMHRAQHMGAAALEWASDKGSDPLDVFQGHLAFFRMVNPRIGCDWHRRFLAVRAGVQDTICHLA